MAKISQQDIQRVKGLGCLQDKRFDDVFNIRVITRNGKITADEQRAIADIADKYGSGEIALTTRLTMEIQGVKYDDIDAVCEELKSHGLFSGGTGAKVRPIVSCKGTTCRFGLIDTFSLSQKIHERFFVGYNSVKLPHKFKIAVGGCPNNCVKPDLNDVGVIGQRTPLVDEEKCRACKVCVIEKNCPIHNAKKQEKIVIDDKGCNNCGRCVGKCPFGAIGEKVTGYRVYIGGRWGKKTANGKMIDKLFESEDEVLDFIEKTINYYKDNGVDGERFADTINRIGFDEVQKALLK